MENQFESDKNTESLMLKKTEDSDDDVIEDLEQRAIWEQKRRKELEQQQQPQQDAQDSDVVIDERPKRYQFDDGQYFFELNGGKKICISRYQGAILVSIRLYYINKSGKNLPSKKGIALSLENWAKLKTYVNDVDDCIQMVTNQQDKE